MNPRDLLVAAYLVRGLQESESFRGLAVGIRILLDMVENFWDDLFPPLKRLRARSTALEWISERAEQSLAKAAVKPDEQVYVELAEADFRALDNLLVDKMAENAPGMAGLGRSLKQLKSRLQQDKVPARPPASSTVSPTAAAPDAEQAKQNESVPRAVKNAAALTDTGPVASDGDAKRVLRQVQDVCRSTGAYWLDDKMLSAKAYRLNRMATWAMIDQAPPAEGGKTQFAAPCA